jgi:hypothetical protein
MTVAQIQSLSRLKSFTGSIELADGIKPKNNGTFPLMEAHDILVAEDDERLD